MNMLYVGCSVCGAIGPLWCAGQFMPHAPIPVVRIPTGVGCQLCGPWPPIFTCMTCRTTQVLYIPGTTSMPTQPMPGATQYAAPVVQATQGATQQEVSGKLSSVVAKATVSVGETAAKEFFKAWFRFPA
jgi:hypothetical protein